MCFFPYWSQYPYYPYRPFAFCTLEECKDCGHKRNCEYRKILLKKARKTKEKVKFDKMVVIR